MAAPILMAEPRTALGKKCKALRREGRIPGVVYGPTMTSTIQVSVDRREFEKFYRLAGTTHPFTLKWEGGSANVIIREVQVDPVRWTPLHIDFYVGPEN